MPALSTTARSPVLKQPNCTSFSWRASVYSNRRRCAAGSVQRGSISASTKAGEAAEWPICAVNFAAECGSTRMSSTRKSGSVSCARVRQKSTSRYRPPVRSQPFARLMVAWRAASPGVPRIGGQERCSTTWKSSRCVEPATVTSRVKRPRGFTALPFTSRRLEPASGGWRVGVWPTALVRVARSMMLAAAPVSMMMRCWRWSRVTLAFRAEKLWEGSAVPMNFGKSADAVSMLAGGVL